MKSNIHFTKIFRLLLVMILFSYACNLIDHLPGAVSQTAEVPEATTKPGEAKTPAPGETVSPGYFVVAGSAQPGTALCII